MDLGRDKDIDGCILRFQSTAAVVPLASIYRNCYLHTIYLVLLTRARARAQEYDLSFG